MDQGLFEFNFEECNDVDEFIVSKCNANAYEFILNSTANMLIIYGEVSSGKTHLAKIWKKNNKASFVSIDQISKLISQFDISECKHFILEDINNIKDEKSLFHFLNFIKESNYSVLLTSSVNPNNLNFKIADLLSRINMITSIKIYQPDEELLKMIFIKEFSKLQINVSNDVLDYIIKNMQRSFESQRIIVEKLDKSSLMMKKKITVPFVKQNVLS